MRLYLVPFAFHIRKLAHILARNLCLHYIFFPAAKLSIGALVNLLLVVDIACSAAATAAVVIVALIVFVVVVIVVLSLHI